MVHLSARRGLDGHLSLARRTLMTFVMVSAIVLVFVPAAWLSITAGAALVLFLTLGWRQFSIGTWVPIMLSTGALILAIHREVPADVLLQAINRMLFLAALISVLGTLRSAAALAREVDLAGAFLTNQPAPRRYLALTLGGHLFGVLINFGGLALLLDLTARSMKSEATRRLPPDVQEVKLKRMSLAIIRGFALISLWSPLGFAANVVLITLPDVSFVDFGPIGLAMTFVFVAIGWIFDRFEGRKYRQLALPRPTPPEGAWKGALMLVGHVLLLGGSVFVLHEVTPLTFQEALISVVPTYAVIWAAASNWSGVGGPLGGIASAASTTWQRMSGTAGEVGVFASAGFLPVVLLALIPVEDLRVLISDLGLDAVSMMLGLSASIVVFALLGVNPIVSASVLGAIAGQLSVPGLSDTAIALAITGGWCAVVGLSPFMTTTIFCGAIIERPATRIALVWNGPYCVTIFLVWCAFLVALFEAGAI
ncbi:hypothetical protein KHP62_08795 [Rhodobacteraceae bacterium NNCM2]|nr:hypothetical protein [Coraliihabitans acroporae]